MPYTVAIVDDEEMMRSGMTRLVPWETMGFHMLGAFKDGDEMIEFLKSGTVDVVLTDVRMARVSGLQLAAHISEHYPDIMTVIISGYQDFAYAQEAMEYGVRQYLLKPVQVKRVREVFASIKQELDARAETIRRDRLIMGKYRLLCDHAEQQLIYDAAHGLLRAPGELERALARSGLQMSTLERGCLMVSMIVPGGEQLPPPEGMPGDPDAAYTWYCVYSENDWLRMALVERAGHAGALATPSSQSAAARALAETYLARVELTPAVYVEKYIPRLRELAEGGCDAWLEQVTPCDDAHAVRLDALTLKNEFIQAARDIADAGGCTTLGCHAQDDPDAPAGRSDSAGTSLREAFCRYCMAACAQSMWDGRFGAMHLLKTLADILSDGNTQLMSALEHVSDARAPLNCVSTRALTDWGLRVIEQMGDVMNDFRIMRDPIEQARRYISENYTRDISLTEVAEHVYLTPAYFSRLFKERTGITFVDYLTDMRIREAARLLCETDICVYDVHECVGYHNLKYFYKRFKKIFDCSPGEYRQRNGRCAR